MYTHRSLMKRGTIAPHENFASPVCHIITCMPPGTAAIEPPQRPSTPGADQNVHGTDEQPARCLIVQGKHPPLALRASAALC